MEKIHTEHGVSGSDIYETQITKLTNDSIDARVGVMMDGQIIDRLMAEIDRRALRSLNAIFQSENGKPVALNDQHLATLRVMLAHKMMCGSIQRAEREDTISHQLLAVAIKAQECITANITGMVMRANVAAVNGDAKDAPGEYLTVIADPAAGFRQFMAGVGDPQGGGPGGETMQ